MADMEDEDSVSVTSSVIDRMLVNEGVGLDDTGDEPSVLPLDEEPSILLPTDDEPSFLPPDAAAELSPSPASDAVSAGDWTKLNRSLEDQGFTPLPLLSLATQSEADAPLLCPEPAQLLNTMHDLLEQYSSRGRAVSDLYPAARDRPSAHEGGGPSSTERVSKALERSESENQQLNARIKALERELDAARDSGTTDARQLRSANSTLTQQLKQSEHRVRAKEAAAEKLTTRVRTMAERERASRTKEKAAFKSIRHRDPQPGSAVDARSLEIIQVYERQRQKMADELAGVRDEVQSLNDALREKENFIMRQELGDAWPTAEGGRGQSALADKYEEQQRVARLMQQREATLKRRVAELEGEVSQLQSELCEVQDGNENLILELKSRPSVRAWTNSQRCIEDLETKLQAAVDAAKEAADVRELRKFMGTRALMERDRVNHKLQLTSLDALPREIAKEILQETCRELQLSDVSLIGPSIRKMVQVMLMVPRLERFVHDVTTFVFKQEALSDHDAQPSQHRTMEEVLPVLVRWRQELTAVKQSDDLFVALANVLSKRNCDPDGARGGQPPSLLSRACRA